VLLDATDSVNRQLEDLRRAGMAVSLDDFGTGYSSLTYLQRYAIDYIKIDQSFVRNMREGSTDLALCKALVILAHELGMKVVAEGVETRDQCNWLKAAGCDYGQGFLFSKPVNVQEFEDFCAQHKNLTE
jgi:EAL domain-containing protein (putative c-di-GMP-specific phosphodiesterase class I)